jgi:hypothetical protein
MVRVHYRHIETILVKYLFTCFLFVSYGISSAQVEAFLSIENQSIAGSNVTFDIFITCASNSPDDKLYLGNADFVIAFNNSMFTNPTLTKIGPSPGNCNLKPTNSTNEIDTIITQLNYFDNCATMISGNILVINLNGPTPGDQNTFDSRVAAIDGASSTHRLGRFKISGINNPGDNPDLKWKTKGNGLKTTVLHLQNTFPFMSSPIILDTDTNTCPDSLSIVESPISSGLYQAGVQLTSSATLATNSLVNLTAGDKIEIQPNFEVPLGASIELSIKGCQ